MTLNAFLSTTSRHSSDVDYRQPVLSLLAAATRALNAYADNSGKPTMSYLVQSRSADYGATAVDVEELYERAARPMQKGSDR